MKNTIRGALLGTAAASLVLAGTGAASAHHLPGEPLIVHPAGSAVAAVPTAANQVCGTVFIGTDNHTFFSPAGPSAGAQAVENVHITGTLGTWTQTVESAADGTWCLQGDPTMATEVSVGGKSVTLSANPATVNGKTGKWSKNGGDAVMNVGEFFLHSVSVGGGTSATNVNFVYS